MTAEKIIHVVIVEDDDEIRPLMELLIDRTPGFTCKSTFRDCESAALYLKENPPDVVLMDIELPGINGIEGIRILHEFLPETDFIMLTIRDDDDAVLQSLAAGATGYLLKDTAPAKLLEGIREVVDGGSPMTPAIARKVTASFQTKKYTVLTNRETEIMQMLCDGHHYGAVAEALFISGHTVRAHIKNIYRKLQVKTRAELVTKAHKNRLV